MTQLICYLNSKFQLFFYVLFTPIVQLVLMLMLVEGESISLIIVNPIFKRGKYDPLNTKPKTEYNYWSHYPTSIGDILLIVVLLAAYIYKYKKL